MVKKKSSRETLPRIFQTFSSLYSSMVHKVSATVVPPSRQLIGEYPPVDFTRLYQYYQGWPQIKRSVDTTHQKFMGAGIEVKSKNPQFQQFINYWWTEVNAQKKFSDFFLNEFITGNGFMELQYTDQKQIGSIESIPVWTFWRIFRDQFGNEIKVVQLIDGVFKELDPQFYIHGMINNPERDAFGKSEFFAVANPRPVAAQVDPTTGQPLNPARVLTPVLDMQALIQDAEMEIKLKMSKPKIFVKAPGMARDDMAKLRAELEDPSSKQYVWVIDSTEIDMAEAKIDGGTKFDNYSMMIDNQIDISTGFASKIVKDPQGFSYSSAQAPFDVLDQRMVDMQAEAVEMIRDKLIKPLAESWGFFDWDDLGIEVSFMPSVRRLSMEDIQKLPTDAVSPEEKRAILKKLHIPLDDKLWDEWNDKQDALKQQQMDALHKQAENGMLGGPQPGYSPKSPTSPTDADHMKGHSAGDVQKSGPTDVMKDRPKPVPLKEVVKEVLKALAEERINLNPNVSDSTYNDIYVSQGLDQEGTPIITDPTLNKKYKEHPNELPGGIYEPEEEEDPELEQGHMPEGVAVKDEGEPNDGQIIGKGDQNKEDVKPQDGKMTDPSITPPKVIDPKDEGTGKTGDYKDFYRGQNQQKTPEDGLPAGYRDTRMGPRDKTPDEQPIVSSDKDIKPRGVYNDQMPADAQITKDFSGPNNLANTKQNQHVGDDDKDKEGNRANHDQQDKPTDGIKKQIDDKKKKLKEDIAGPPASAMLSATGTPKKKKKTLEEREVEAKEKIAEALSKKYLDDKDEQS